MSFHSSQFTVILDACVLYPAPLRDLLMRLTLSGLFRARWTNQIHEEWINALLIKRPDITREQLDRTKKLMNDGVLDCLVTGYEFLIDTITLPDLNDRHVVAAAIRGQADLIVTTNLKHFPVRTLAIYDLEAKHPDDFICEQFDLQGAKVIQVVAEHRAALKNPPKSQDEYLNTLLGIGLAQTVERLQEWKRAF
ncbi:MAG: PIN domain-containing protein [Acidithiobacillus sp.]